jgi:hypothetical protein
MIHARPFLRAGLAIALLTVAGALGGCTNEFVVSFEGTRYPPVTDTAIVSAKPEGSGLIGTATFVSGGNYGNPEALAAGREVGADSVRWWRSVASRSGVTGQGTVSGGLSPTGPVSAWSPAQPGPLFFSYQARFYRKGVEDQVPAVDAEDRGTTRPAVPARSDPAQVERDSTAATQEQAQVQRAEGSGSRSP